MTLNVQEHQAQLFSEDGTRTWLVLCASVSLPASAFCSHPPHLPPFSSLGKAPLTVSVWWSLAHVGLLSPHPSAKGISLP